MTMTKRVNESLIVALDIGTSKICVLVGQESPSGEIEVIGFGCHPSHGLKKGVVVNIESTVQSIQRALEEAELMAGCDINSAYTGIAGSHISSINSHGIVAIREREVQQTDIDRVIDAAKAVAIPADQKILHVLPQEYIIDTQDGVREPVGMSGVRLEAKVHIVTGAVSAAQNIVKCVKRCGLVVGDIILEQLASSNAVLSEDEKELGVCMVDIGGGTTDIAVFVDGAIRHTSVIPIAGDHVTSDVAVALRTPTKFAEKIKIQFGAAQPDSVDADQMIDVPGMAGRSTRHLSKKALAQVISARYEELFGLVLSELRRSGFEDLVSAGIVLTGGASAVPGAAELAESVFHMPVRIGMPQNVKGLVDVRENPSFSTAVGLLLYGQQERHAGHVVVNEFGGGFKSIWNRMKHWFHGAF
jgi:cell division protein FtsA